MFHTFSRDDEQEAYHLMYYQSYARWNDNTNIPDTTTTNNLFNFCGVGVHMAHNALHKVSMWPSGQGASRFHLNSTIVSIKLPLHNNTVNYTQTIKMFMLVKFSSLTRWLLQDWFVVTQYCSRWITARKWLYCPNFCSLCSPSPSRCLLVP